ncbi:uncharacterized protein LOC130671682 [Microplitis mediator]|uniref:uncharacterized protein LOC130671682 n=1 Tax=Microplitis mediator TaxID=375433 RepID=UPI0025533D8C|nr:uncharacterized protein LOC130671682 [Microplitis mediator]
MLRVTSSLLVLIQLNSIVSIAQENHSPVLLFPKNSVFQFTIGVSVPLLATNKKGNVVFSAGFQFNYALPWNLTQLQSPTIVPSRHTDDFDLKNIYMSIENLLDRVPQWIIEFPNLHPRYFIYYIRRTLTAAFACRQWH